MGLGWSENGGFGGERKLTPATLHGLDPRASGDGRGWALAGELTCTPWRSVAGAWRLWWPELHGEGRSRDVRGEEKKKKEMCRSGCVTRGRRKKRKKKKKKKKKKNNKIIK